MGLYLNFYRRRVIRSYRTVDNHECKILRRPNADKLIGRKQKWSYIQRSTLHRWDPFSVKLQERMDAFHEDFFGHGWHAHPLSRLIHPFQVCRRAKDQDFAVG